jgi:hypothetical protein
MKRSSVTLIIAPPPADCITGTASTASNVCRSVPVIATSPPASGVFDSRPEPGATVVRVGPVPNSSM